ncbi:hypothetical protein P618_200224 [Holospora obtusa F1]|uniref:Outer membrane protein beta-barrel domain-containing protein n=1 Tax=Holospora obtusa F1 TaxID=1399147 RepID=W6TEE6_HOLOB|nr:outer membrane beta-barrel protein [Holospora obtusa]ETZ07588.1 hypothetical protein P618_200224 [Holospora obtusa F1]
MNKQFKSVFFSCLLAFVVHAKESGFQSGIGFTVGLGTASSSTQAKDGAGSDLDFKGFKLKSIRDGHVIHERTVGIPNNYTNFTEKGVVKSRSGFSWHLGMLMQKKVDSYTFGVRWIFGENNSSSKINYTSGKIFMQNTLGGPVVERILGVLKESSTNFRLKNKWFTSFIFEFGYLVGKRVQLFAGPGVVFQRQKLSCVNEFGKSSSGLSKTVSGPMIALGARYALTQRMALGLEYQRQWLNKRTWHKVSKILPQDAYAYGMPTLKTNNNLFLVTLSYMFSSK